MSTGGVAGVKYYKGKADYSTDTLSFKSKDETKILSKYIYSIIESHIKEINDCYFKGITIKHLQKPSFYLQKIPVPPIQKQQEIVNLLIEKDNEIEQLRQGIQIYEREIVSILTNITNGIHYKIKDIGSIKMCKRVFKSQTSYNGDVPFYKIGTLGSNPESYIPKQLFIEYKEKYPYPRKGDVLVSVAGTIGKTWIFDGNPAYFQDSNIVWVENDESKILNSYLARLYKVIKINASTGGSVSRSYNDLLENTELVVPSIDIQKQKIKQFTKLEDEISKSKNKIDDLLKQKRIKLLEALS